MAAAAYCRHLPARPMLIDFFYALRGARLPVSIHEYLALLEALEARVLDDDGGPTVERFYQLARTALVKDEVHLDKFDRAFAAYFKGVETVADFTRELPLDWLRQTLERELGAEALDLPERGDVEVCLLAFAHQGFRGFSSCHCRWDLIVGHSAAVML